MATRIFVDQENGDLAYVLTKDRIKVSTGSAKLQPKGHPGKVFGSSGAEKRSRKALGTVNKQNVAQKTVPAQKDGLIKVKSMAVNQKMSKGSIKPNKQNYPEIETCIPYDPLDFETFNVPEEHKLSHLCLAAIPLMVNENDATQLESLINQEPAPMDIPINCNLAGINMATKIFVDQENVVAPVLSKDHLKLSKSANPQKANTGKVFGSSGQKSVRKALGNVNKQVVSQKAVTGKKNELKVKNPAPVTKVSEACLKTKEQNYPEIEKIFPYNPEDFENFDVPEQHRLSHLCLAGVPLMIDTAPRFTTSGQELAPMDIPVFSWDSELSGPSFLTTVDEITLDLPQW
ncbi:uncharacterized protein PAF06_009388 [Gastrophryne carolinensis]